ncbi:MAG: UDP-N-acetylmuramate dehydrogenase [Deltaproteobacteria bacterium]|nr:UDP-N-acetylmuramate dehydrogenase [Deltaproteobacteria bacterium]
MLSPKQQEKLRSLLKGELLFEEPLAKYTSLKIGGPAQILFYPTDLEDLSKALQWCKTSDCPYFILGSGSNLLVRDGGIRAMVCKLSRALNQLTVQENEKSEDVFIEVEAGYSLAKLVELSRQKGWTGIESLFGIPGTLGGALVMNAGTREGEIGTRVEEVSVMNSDGEVRKIPAKRLHFEYRFLKLNRGEILIKAKLRLKKVDASEVAERIQFFQKRRFETQPLDQANVGSIFKNPPKKFAAQLIEELGLKGVRVGGARISEKHSNWIINEGGATAQDVLALIGLVKDKVKETAEIKLEVEVKVVGEEANSD